MKVTITPVWVYSFIICLEPQTHCAHCIGQMYNMAFAKTHMAKARGHPKQELTSLTTSFRHLTSRFVRDLFKN